MTTLLKRSLDTALDRSIVLGYSCIGYGIRSRWFEDRLPPLDGRAFAVTGATSGIGTAAAEGLAALGARVILLVRDPGRGEETRGKIIESTGNAQIEVVTCDLASLASVRDAARELSARAPQLAGLVNNAGVLPPQRERSADGIELTFATNVVGPFLLTNLLIPVLRSGAPARVITVSSGGMYAQRLHPDDLQMEREDFDGTTAYARTKRAQVVLGEAWAKRLASREITFHTMHPGWANTPGVETSLPRFYRVMRPILRTPEEGADTIVWLAAAPEPGDSTGRFWHDRRPRPTHLLPTTRETPQQREQLWQQCIALSGYDPAEAGVDTSTED